MEFQAPTPLFKSPLTRNLCVAYRGEVFLPFSYFCKDSILLARREDPNKNNRISSRSRIEYVIENHCALFGPISPFLTSDATGTCFFEFKLPLVNSTKGELSRKIRRRYPKEREISSASRYFAVSFISKFLSSTLDSSFD